MPKDLEDAGRGRAVVIGGGFGGIAAALRLRAKGRQVTLIDRCPRLGGRAQVFEKDGFRHDAGPTVITAPFLFEELFEIFGKKMSDYVTLVEPDPWYRFRFPDGDQFDYGPTEERTMAEIERISPSDVEGYKKLGEHSKRIYDVGFEELSARPFHNPLFMMKQIPTLLRLRSHESVWGMISRFVKHDKLRRAFSIQPLLLGGNPFDTTSIYGLINYLERKSGVWFAMGGTGAMIDAFAKLMEEEGVEVRLNETVNQVLVENGRVVGVEVEGQGRIDASIVVSNADPMHLYRTMLPKGAGTRLANFRAKRATLSMGLYVLYFGARRQWPEVAHHTVWFGDRYKELLADIFHRKVLAEDFSLYVHRPTATDPSFAPPGCDSFYVLSPVPNLQGDVDWSVEGPKLRARIVEALDRTMLPGLKESICAEFDMTPVDFQDRYLSVDGAGFSIAPFFRQSAYFRFHNRGEGVRGLYLVGAGAHPGAGVPGVISSAKVVDQLIPAAEPAR